jgi:fucose 4-O-acetylase-like acetyltransferase
MIIPIYYLGFLYKKYETKIIFNKYFAIVSFFILILFMKISNIKIESIYSVVGSPDKAVLFLILSPLAGCYLVFYISKLISLTFLSDIFLYIGKNTIIILALHFLCFKVVTLLQLFIYGYPFNMLSSFPVIENRYWFIAYSIVGIGIPIIISKTMNIFNPNKYNLLHKA